MLFRLYSDSINVSNVDLYYINNSQVYGGLCLLNGKNTFDTVKNLSFRKIKNYSFDIKCGVLFYLYFGVYFTASPVRFDPLSVPYF